MAASQFFGSVGDFTSDSRLLEVDTLSKGCYDKDLQDLAIYTFEAADASSLEFWVVWSMTTFVKS